MTPHHLLFKQACHQTGNVEGGAVAMKTAPTKMRLILGNLVLFVCHYVDDESVQGFRVAIQDCEKRSGRTHVMFNLVTESDKAIGIYGVLTADLQFM